MVMISSLSDILKIMFTGIVETIGKISSVSDNTLDIIAGKFSGRLKIGGSISVKGACLTITSIKNTQFTVDVVNETRRKTNLGDLKIASSVNLELPVPVTGSFDGHIVQGHIDNTIKVISIIEESDSKLIKFKTNPLNTKYLVKKGFVAVDGVSLTIVECQNDWFSIALIPHTSKNTTLGDLKVGDTTNLELDLFAKYAEKFLTR